MRYTIFCECGRFAHDVDILLMSRLMSQHTQALIFPADLYAEMVNDILAEADWVISP